MKSPDGGTGLDLRLARTRARVKAKHVASILGVSAQRVSQIEREATPSALTVQRYLMALAIVEEAMALGARLAKP